MLPVLGSQYGGEEGEEVGEVEVGGDTQDAHQRTGMRLGPGRMGTGLCTQNRSTTGRLCAHTVTHLQCYCVHLYLCIYSAIVYTYLCLHYYMCHIYSAIVYTYLCLYRCMTPLMHSTAGCPEKNGILSLRTAVAAFSFSLTEEGGEWLAVAKAYVLSPSLQSVGGGENGREGIE